MQGNLWQEVVLFRGLPGDIVRGPLLGKGKEDLQRGVLGAKDGSSEQAKEKTEERSCGLLRTKRLLIERVAQV